MSINVESLLGDSDAGVYVPGELWAVLYTLDYFFIKLSRKVTL